jgi:hypothetical protein
MVLRIYDGILDRGHHSIPWDTVSSEDQNLAPGAYWVRISNAIGSSSRKIVIVR